MKYQNYLICGISLMLVLLNSCKKDYVYSATWIYINETDSLISFQPVREEFTLAANGEYVYTESGEGEKEMDVKNFVPPHRPFIVYFGSSLCDTLFSGSSANTGDGLLGIENYQAKKLENNSFQFTFRFTDSMLSKVQKCR